MPELVIPAHIRQIQTLDPGEVRVFQFSLPKQWEVEGRVYPVHDHMRPGTAFLIKPWGSRTKKWRRRMYTRSNSCVQSEYLLETIINHTHTDKSDTSVWWQTDEVESWQGSGKPLDVRVEWNNDSSALRIFENSQKCHATNLRLEPDGEWEHMQFMAVAFSTGITPFLAYLRYMKYFKFGRSQTSAGARFTLITSVRHPQQLMAHEELRQLEAQFPDNFRYHPVLTRSWPEDWPFTTGRIVQTRSTFQKGSTIDLRSLQAIVPNIQQLHVRFCGNTAGRDQLRRGFAEQGIEPLSFRAEVW